MEEVLGAIELARSAGMAVVLIDGVKRKPADRAVTLAGLLDYFPPGLVGPILRAAAKQRVAVRAANLPDTDTIARSAWVALTTARSFGVNLGSTAASLSREARPISSSARFSAGSRIGPRRPCSS